MKYKPIIIGIAGTKGSGKDTVASMINYILRVGLAKADYYTWVKESQVKDNNNIIHFADALKDICSLVFNIPRQAFNETQQYKDNNFWIFTDEQLVSCNELTNRYHIITINDLINNNLSLPDTRLFCNKQGRISCISLRTIMQYIGTELFRNKVSKNTWIDICINKAINISDKGYCIIPDVRFKNEVESIKNIADRASITIKLIRNIDTNDSHESEKIDFKCDYEIENIGTKMALFYKILMLLNDVIK